MLDLGRDIICSTKRTTNKVNFIRDSAFLCGKKRNKGLTSPVIETDQLFAFTHTACLLFLSGFAIKLHEEG